MARLRWFLKMKVGMRSDHLTTKKFDFFISLVSIYSSNPAFCSGFFDYFKKYQPGIEFSAKGTQAEIYYQYKIPEEPNNIPKSCEQNPLDNSLMDCRFNVRDGKSGSNLAFNFIAQQPFKRQGWTYINADLGFSTYSLDARIDPSSDKEYERQNLTEVDQPIENGFLHLYGGIAKGYVELGLTPRYLPDLIFSYGYGGQILFGNIKLGTTRKRLRLLSNTSYFKYEVVWLRFGNGLLGSYISGDLASERIPLYDGEIKGVTKITMHNSAISFCLLKFVWPH